MRPYVKGFIECHCWSFAHPKGIFQNNTSLFASPKKVNYNFTPGRGSPINPSQLARLLPETVISTDLYHRKEMLTLLVTP